MIPHIKNLSNKINDLQSIRTTGGVTSVQSGFIVKNTEATTIKKYSVVELISGLLNPDTNISTRAAWGNSPPIINVRKPLTGAVNLAVMVQSAKAGKTGRASNKGILKAKVNISNADHTFATISNGSDVLVSATEGEFNLLNCTGGTGEQLAYVSLAGSSGGGGGKVEAKEYVEIIEGLQYATSAEMLGRGQYVCRLTSDGTAAWTISGGSEEGDYPLDFIVIGSDNKKYQCKLQAGSGAMNPVEDTEEVNWFVLPSEVPVKIWHDSEADMRHYIPWLKAGQVYPVREHKFDGINDEYVFDLNFIKIGQPGYGTFVVDEETLQVNIAVGDIAP